MKFKILLTAVSLLSMSFSTFAESAKLPNNTAPLSIRVTPPAPKFTDSERQTELAARRAKVLAAMADKSMLVLFSAQSKLYAGDVDYVYRQENNLYYLTNLRQNNAALVLIKNGADSRELLFLPNRNPARESWDGKMYAREDATRISGLKTIADFAEFKSFLQAVKEKKVFASADQAVSLDPASENIYLLLPESENDSIGKREYVKEAEFSNALSGNYKVQNAQPIFGQLRLIKSPFEQKLLQHAIDITTEAQMRAMATARQVKWEYETQAEIEYIFRKRNADFWGYPSIVGCGPNATTLHYVESQGAVKSGDLLLMDVGAEYDHYTADVTRTFPVNGKFTKEQAEIYQIVYDAQEAAAKATVPGASFSKVSQAAEKVVKEGLTRLGLITAPDATFQVMFKGKPYNQPQFRLWYLHGLGHWLGMNVHDVGEYSTPLREGMVYTNEPGVYLREDALEYVADTDENRAFLEKVRPAYQKYKNIGVRIEDDMIVTKTGVDWMTRNLPRKISEIEAFMAANSSKVALTVVGNENRSHFAALDSNSNFLRADFEFNLFSHKAELSGNTIRRGWISVGKQTASASENHLHSHAE